MNTPVKFEIAKLLKEKKCDLNHEYMAFTYVVTEKYPEGELFLKPTIAEVVMWLYEKHGIWIVINPHKGEDDLGKPFMEFDPEVWSFTNECIFHNTKLLYFNSPTEAYEAAIEYTLNNLI